MAQLNLHAEGKPLRAHFRNAAHVYIFIISLLLFLSGIWKQAFIDFESRFAIFAKEMLLSGVTLFPTVYGKPYPDYPAGSTILVWLFSLPFGEVFKFTAILPTALASALIVTITYKLFSYYSRQWALLTICFELLTATFLWQSRTISIDQILSAMAIFSFYIVDKSKNEKKPVPNLLYLILPFGFLVRGPIGLIVPASAALSSIIINRSKRETISYVMRSAALLLGCMMAQYGMTAILYGKAFLFEVLNKQVASRFAESDPFPIYHYFTSSFSNYALSYPIAVVVLTAIVFNKFKGNNNDHKEDDIALLIRTMIVWIAMVMIGMSIPETKKIRYIVSLVPPLAGLAAYPLIAHSDGRFLKLRKFIELIVFLIPLLVTALVYRQAENIAKHITNVNLWMIIIAGLFLANILMMLISSSREKILFVFATGAFSVYLAFTAIIEPYNLRMHDTSQLARVIEEGVQRKPGNVAFYGENPDGYPIKIIANMSAPSTPTFISDIGELGCVKDPIWIVARNENIDRLEPLSATSSDVYQHVVAGNKFIVFYYENNRPEGRDKNACK